MKCPHCGGLGSFDDPRRTVEVIDVTELQRKILRFLAEPSNFGRYCCVYDIAWAVYGSDEYGGPEYAEANVRNATFKIRRNSDFKHSGLTIKSVNGSGKGYRLMWGENRALPVLPSKDESEAGCV